MRICSPKRLQKKTTKFYTQEIKSKVFWKLLLWLMKQFNKSDEDYKFDDDDDVFCGIVNRQKTFTRYFQSTPLSKILLLQISDTQRAKFEPA